MPYCPVCDIEMDKTNSTQGNLPLVGYSLKQGFVSNSEDLSWVGKLSFFRGFLKRDLWQPSARSVQMASS